MNHQGYLRDDLSKTKQTLVKLDFLFFLDDSGMQAIKDAIADYHKFTCIRFKPRINERQYLYFYRGPGYIQQAIIIFFYGHL